MFLKPFQDIESIHSRHFQIHENDARQRMSLRVLELSFATQVFHGFNAVFRNLHWNRNLISFQGELKENYVIWIVLDQ